MHIHILGIGGTFMAGIAILAKQNGFKVTGSDKKLYPPMSDQLKEQNIQYFEGYSPENLNPTPDVVVIGNALSRGNPEVEAVLNRKLPYVSGPQWLAENILNNKKVLAVAGTHGKTTTSSILAWIMEYAGKKPGFLIGGIPKNFSVSACKGEGEFFVVEADEYDTAFFDKRSKFVHYRPFGLILNNLEFDHADIFEDLNAIKKQFHHLLRTVPGNGKIIFNAADENIQDVINQGCWTACESFSLTQGDWHAKLLKPDGSEFEVIYQGKTIGTVVWQLIGSHNVNNALAAIALATNVGVDTVEACAALASFKNVKRRLEIRGTTKGITVYDDFAHHPTAIFETLSALRNKVNDKKIFAIAELGSNTMKLGTHDEELIRAFDGADRIYLYKPEGDKQKIQDILHQFLVPTELFDEAEGLISAIKRDVLGEVHLLIMSNKSFAGIHERLLKEL